VEAGNRLLVRIKIFFNAVNITFPILLVRNSVLLATKQGKKANKLELNWNDLFSKQADLVNAKTTHSEFPIDMSTLKNQLEQFKALYEITKLTDKSFVEL
jgi:hypothetical protein